MQTVAWHEGTVRDAIHALKYQGQRRVARPLGDVLARYLQSRGEEIDVVIPVPLNENRRRERGFNQAALLARRCAAKLDVQYLPEALVRQRPTRPQVGLSQAERHENVVDAFMPGRQGTPRHLAGKRIVLIDDVITTGSTLNAAAAALAPLHPSTVLGLALTRPAPRWLPATHVVWVDDHQS
ncbi:MAG: ComF family protein [Ktedonobacterales bacterium]